jgi:hypothetical protein
MEPFDRRRYAESLRTIGQALETLKLGSFALKRDGNNCVVQGEARLPVRGEQFQLNSRSALPGIWVKLQRQRREHERCAPLSDSPLAMELFYSPADIAQLEREGRARRRDPDGIPYPNSLPQLLRAVGTYLDGKGARLVGLVRRKNRVTIYYNMGTRRCYREQLTAPLLHEISVCMYLRRTIRAECGKNPH